MKKKKILIGTGNPAKEEQIRLAAPEISFLSLRDFSAEKVKVVEDGKTALENARKKALVYSREFRKVVLAMDNALYLDGLDDDSQPGIKVRRIPGIEGRRPTDQEMLEYYQGIIERLSKGEGKLKGRWEFAVCLATPEGDFFETIIPSERVFVTEASVKKIEGYPLESLQIDSETGKYISEMTEEEKAAFWQRKIGKPLQEFLKKTEKEL